VRWTVIGALLTAGVCCGQAEFKIPLEGANTSLAVPALATADGVVYAAYRSFDWLRFSSELHVLAYDPSKRKEVRRVTISVPKVHGARASEGLAVSADGHALAYVEAYDPCLVLLLSTTDLSEIRRTVALPFSAQDHQRIFAGFDQDQLALASNVYQYARPEMAGLRFIRLSTSDLKPSSDTKAPGIAEDTLGSNVWQPSIGRIWASPFSVHGTGGWREYTEGGQSAGQEFEHRSGISYGAIALGKAGLLAFYGNMIAKGAVVGYTDHHTAELNLECVPRPYGISNDPDYAGALCATERDVLPENRGDKTLSSEFLLLRTTGPTVVWRQKMGWVAVANSNEPDAGMQKGDPLIYRSGRELWIVAPTKLPTLTVYELRLPE